MTDTLYYRQGTSDKVYQVEMTEVPGGWEVRFAFGPRGGTMKPGTKTDGPVPRDKAEDVYRRLVAEKTAKGYTPGEAGAAMVPTVAGAGAGEASAFVPPSLPADISEDEFEARLRSMEWSLEEKHDGDRIQLHRQGDRVFAFSKLGRLREALPEPVVRAALAMPWTCFIVDGELVGETFWLFDVMEAAGIDMRGYSRATRYALYRKAVPVTQGMRTVEADTVEADKRQTVAAIRARGGEGVVLKHHAAGYTPGKFAGAVCKFKFVTTASVIVKALNAKGKRSFVMALADGEVVGNCTVPVNQPIPALGDVVEVRYLYYVGSLVQPVLLGIRGDVLPSECTAAQLQARAEVKP